MEDHRIQGHYNKKPRFLRKPSLVGVIKFVCYLHSEDMCTRLSQNLCRHVLMHNIVKRRSNRAAKGLLYVDMPFLHMYVTRGNGNVRTVAARYCKGHHLC